MESKTYNISFDTNYLEHIGNENSGRYPRGSGKNPYQHEKISSIYNKYLKIEPKITSDVVNVIQQSGSKVYGIENKIKTLESLTRKIKTDSVEQKISIKQAAKNINDILRYTSLSNDSKFLSSYNNIKKNLDKKGYKEIKCKNYFDMYKKGLAKHKQVTSVFQDTDGNKFEIQFQTTSSIKAKELKTPLYEELRKLNTSEKRKKELIKQMEKLAEKVSTPKGVDKILSHSNTLNNRRLKMESKTYNISFNTNYLEHIGNKNSGRYPRGSGENPRAERGMGGTQQPKKSIWQKIIEANRIRRQRQRIKALNNSNFKYKATTKNINSLSDEELDMQLSRLQKEVKLKQAIDELNGGPKKPGVIATSGKKVLASVLPVVGTYAIAKKTGLGNNMNLGTVIYNNLLKPKKK